MISDEFVLLPYGDNNYINKNGVVKKVWKNGKEKIKKHINGKNGYIYVSLSKQYKKPLHRLLAETFIPNPYNLRNVDHKNRDKKDNRLENLRWFSQQDNMLNRDDSEGKNIYYSEKIKKWEAKSGNFCIGRFDTENEARACKYGYLRAKEIESKKN